MPSAVHSWRRERAIALGAAVVLVVFRSSLFLWWEQSHFDADQAIVGLMAKHLTEGRAFPLFFYGQQYLLGVEAWLVAPFFLLFGISVLTLKLPLLLLNVAAAVLLLLRLERDAGVRPALGLLACVFFVLPPPGTASRLVQANGCNIEPFIYVLALWLLRHRPIAFGLVAGVGVLHREFVVYGVSAILLIEWWQGTLFSRRRLAGLAVSALAALAVWEVVQVLIPFASASGPGSSYADLRLTSHAYIVRDRFCWNPGELDDRGWLLVSQWLPQMFGARFEPITKVGVMSVRHQGVDGLWLALVATALLAAGRLVFLESRRRAGPAAGGPAPTFCVFLILIGLQSAVVYAVMCGQRSHLTMRYMLLALLAPVGVSAWYFTREPRRTLRVLHGSVLAAWALVSAASHVGLWQEYLNSPPPSLHRTLATHLERNGIRAGSAGFWEAYAVTFLTEERVRLASTDLVRITEYQEALTLPRSVAPHITTVPCEGSGARAGNWWVCR